MAKVTNLSLGTGRRKTSVARVYLRSGNGAIMVNGKSVEAYFANPEHVFTVKQPLVATASEGKFDILINVKGVLTRDSRMVERKKYGRRGARRRFQFSKR